MCVACREVRDQRDLVRLVRTPEGVTVDERARGKTPGRGAYLCRRVECWERAAGASRARGGGPLGHALRAPLGDEDRARLEDFARRLADERPAGPAAEATEATINTETKSGAV
jgi:hypothetical protein